MDTRKLNVETYACSCEGGTEYGLVIKDTNPKLPEGEDVLFDIITHDSGLPAPHSEAEAYNLNGQQDIATELVRRWNTFNELKDHLQGLLTAARKAASHAEHSPDYAEMDAHHVGEWIDSASEFLAKLNK